MSSMAREGATYFTNNRASRVEPMLFCSTRVIFKKRKKNV